MGQPSGYGQPVRRGRVHVALAIVSVYERRTFRLPPLELLRIALGLWLPVMLIGHAVTTRLEYELVGAPSTYARVVSDLWARDGEWQHMGLLAPGWLHGCLGLNFAFGRRPFWRRYRFVLFSVALLLPVRKCILQSQGGTTRKSTAQQNQNSPSHLRKIMQLRDVHRTIASPRRNQTQVLHPIVVHGALMERSRSAPCLTESIGVERR